jgi:hypothetical protein
MWRTNAGNTISAAYNLSLIVSPARILARILAKSRCAWSTVCKMRSPQLPPNGASRQSGSALPTNSITWLRSIDLRREWRVGDRAIGASRRLDQGPLHEVAAQPLLRLALSPVLDCLIGLGLCNVSNC